MIEAPTGTLPSLVLFDLDGVLVEYDRGRRIRHLARGLDVDEVAVWNALFASGLEDRFDAGELDAAQYLGELGTSLGTPVSRALWAAARGAGMRLDPALPALLAGVSEHHDIAVLTNNGALLVDVLPELLPALVAPFAGRLLCSGRLGVRKPDPRIYLEALRGLGHEPERTLFLDDVEANVRGAERAGLRGVRVESPTKLRAVLQAHGLVG